VLAVRGCSAQPNRGGHPHGPFFLGRSLSRVSFTQFFLSFLFFIIIVPDFIFILFILTVKLPTNSGTLVQTSKIVVMISINTLQISKTFFSIKGRTFSTRT